ncbi:tumor necrosis factor receptor superfamily member 14-like isoform X3 [Denticeps clupeoides]|uniref:tumor necrosis factor receptor superfamily member 14-like isoform X3 n=1 Tax=Denticeps clupeoides TaxID=299321 RepID=UPI0010A58D90|nr:tumor necrosis factor receptor superfamily member 14-like isoform X3 [Denticeps clupeoides]
MPCLNSCFSFSFLRLDLFIDHGSIMFGYFSAACLYITVSCVLSSLGQRCGPLEYLHKTEGCCPMCDPGLVVSKDCTEYSSTSCIPCITGQTYMNEPNGLSSCFRCKSCDSGQGLLIKDKCTITRNTVCDLHPGYYCVSYSGEGECNFGEKHQKCGPGQRVKTPGTKSADTVCEECPDGFYSTAGINCTKWTDCAITGEEENEKGNSTKDVTCWRRSRARIGLVSSFVFILSTLIACTLWWYLQTKTNKDHSKSRQDNSPVMIPQQDTQPPCPTTSPCVAQPIEDECPEMCL